MYQATYKRQKFAVKCDLYEWSKEESSQSLELYISSHSQRPNIVRFIDSFYEHGSLFIVTELMDMNLWNAIFERKLKLDTRKVFNQILDAGIFHSDISPSNVLLTRNRKVAKLCDFGSAEIDPLFDGVLRTSVYYAAPEIFQKFAGSLNAVNDVWSLGVILVNLLTRTVPWKEPSMDYSIVESFASNDIYG